MNWFLGLLFAAVVALLAVQAESGRLGAIRRVCCSPVSIFALALFMRLLVGTVLLGQGGRQLFYAGNEPSHIAANLAAGRGFSAPYEHVPIAPTAQQPPLYPVLLAAIFRLCGAYSLLSLSVAAAVNALAGAGTAVLIYFAGRQHFSAGVGLFAAWIWTLYPWEALAGLPLANYELSALVVAGWLVIAPKLLAKSARKRDWILLGIGAGAAMLLNSAMGGVLLASLAWIQFNNKPAYRLSLAVLTFILVLAPWTVRNYLTLHRLVLVRDNFGLELFLGNHAGMSGEVDFSEDFPTHDPRQYSQLGEVRFMELKEHEAIRFIRDNPAGFAARFSKRLLAFWTAPGFLPWAAISFLAWLGAVAAATKTSSHAVGLFLTISFALVPLVYYVTHFWPTYRHPIEPLMLLAAAAGIRQIRSSLWPRAAV